MIVGSFALQSYEPPNNRYHQHLEEPGYTPCMEHDDELFCSHLPLVIIETGGQEIPGKVTDKKDIFGEQIYTTAEDGTETIQVTVDVIDNQNSNNHLGDSPDFSSKTEFRIRGHASRKFEKSPYLLKFVDEQGAKRNISVMGMDAHDKWILHGPYLDKSLIRNYIGYNWAGEIMEYAPNVRYCEVFLNGEYQGVYLMVEAIDNGDDCRLDLSKTEKNQKAVGYLLRIDRSTEAELDSTANIYTYSERMMHLRENLTIRYPGQSTLTDELANRIEMEFAEFEISLYSYDYDSDKNGYKRWIDAENFADYFVINELLCNNDAGRYSTYLYKDMSQKYKLCVWDFNNACNNFPDDVMALDSYAVLDRMIYMMLFKNEEFVDRVLSRYYELRQTVLSEESMFEYIDDTLTFLGPAVQRNSDRWKDSIENWSPLTPVERNVYSQEEAVVQVKEFLHQRGTWLDENIHALQQFSSESKNKAYNH